MNCCLHDLAIVIHDQLITHPLTGAPLVAVKSGVVVKLVGLHDGTMWEIEEPIRFTVDMLFATATLTCWAICDSELRPLRDCGDDAVDEMLVRVGAPEFDGVPA